MKILFSTSKVRPEAIRYMKKRTAEEIEQVPGVSPQLLDSIYSIKTPTGKLVIDNETGLGNTPNNQEVFYKGFVALLTLDNFLNLAEDFPKGARDESVEDITELVDQGYGLAAPMLYLNIDEYIGDLETTAIPRIVGHEGRARSLFMKQRGVKEFFVHFIMEGYRAKNIKDRQGFHTYLQRGVKKQASAKVYRNVFQHGLLW